MRCHFRLTSAAQTTLKIFDLSGRLVTILVDGMLPRGASQYDVAAPHP
jgi:hypothetical protein